MSIDVKILKSSCCTNGESIASKLKKAAANAGIDIQLETLTDLSEIMKYGVMHFPSIVVDGDVYQGVDIDDSEYLEQVLKEHSN